jgi:hypothetical protein
VRIKVGDVKDFENNRNYKGMTIEDRKRELKVYKANIMRIIRHLICLKEYKNIESRFNIINSGSDIKSRFKAMTRS